MAFRARLAALYLSGWPSVLRQSVCRDPGGEVSGEWGLHRPPGTPWHLPCLGHHHGAGGPAPPPQGPVPARLGLCVTLLCAHKHVRPCVQVCNKHTCVQGIRVHAVRVHTCPCLLALGAQLSQMQASTCAAGLGVGAQTSARPARGPCGRWPTLASPLPPLTSVRSGSRVTLCMGRMRKEIMGRPPHAGRRSIACRTSRKAALLLLQKDQAVAGAESWRPGPAPLRQAPPLG